MSQTVRAHYDGIATYDQNNLTYDGEVRGGSSAMPIWEKRWRYASQSVPRWRGTK